MTGSTSPGAGTGLGTAGCTGLGTAAGPGAGDPGDPGCPGAGAGPGNCANRFKMPVVVKNCSFFFTFSAIWSHTSRALAFKRPESVLHEFLRLSTNVMSFTLP